MRWLRSLTRRERPASADAARDSAPDDEPALWAIEPPDGVRLVGSGPARTGEGGHGVVARYSDGTTAAAVVNSDGSVRVLFFRAGATLPAVALPHRDGAAPRFTWRGEAPPSA